MQYSQNKAPKQDKFFALLQILTPLFATFIQTFYCGRSSVIIVNAHRREKLGFQLSVIAILMETVLARTS